MSNDIIKRPIREISEAPITPNLFTPDYKSLPGNAKSLIKDLIRLLADYDKRNEFTKLLRENNIPSDAPHSVVRKLVLHSALKLKSEIGNVYKNLLVRGVSSKVIFSEFDFKPPETVSQLENIRKEIDKITSKVESAKDDLKPLKYFEKLGKEEENVKEMTMVLTDAEDEIWEKETLLNIIAPFISSDLFHKTKKLLTEKSNQIEEVNEEAHSLLFSIRNLLMIDGSIWDASGKLEPDTTLEEYLDVFEYTKDPQGAFFDESKPTHFGLSNGSMDETEIIDAIKKKFPNAKEIKIYDDFQVDWDRYFFTDFQFVSFKVKKKDKGKDQSLEGKV